MEQPITTKNVGQPCVICGQAADAQATIAALQAEVKERTWWLAAYKQSIELAQSSLTQRTAELEAANKRIHDLECQHQDLCLRNQILRDRPDLPVERASFHAEVVRMQAELERVRGEFAETRELVAALSSKVAEYEIELNGDPQNFYGRGRTVGLRTLIAALPKVEVITSDTVVNIVQQYNFHRWMLRALQYRQGMEG